MKNIPRTLVVEVEDSPQARYFLPSELPIVRSDGVRDFGTAILNGHWSYTYLITDEDLDQALDQGRVIPSIDWIKDDRDDHQLALRAVSIRMKERKPERM